MNKNIKILSLVLVGIAQFSLAQIKEERLILDRKREPEVKKIEKKKTSVETEKNYPLGKNQKRNLCRSKSNGRRRNRSNYQKGRRRYRYPQNLHKHL